MKRALLWTIGIYVAVSLALFLSGYGIRLQEKPCTHFIGFGTAINYVTKDCQRFRWELPVH